MTDAAQDQKNADQQEKYLSRFEKSFRLMDSSADGEAEAAFRAARNYLPKIGLTFSELLEMVGKGGGEDTAELEQLVGAYKDANDQLKAAEEILLSENARLNLLLRNFRDTKTQYKDLDITSFKKAIEDMVDKTKTVHKAMEDLQLPANADELDKLYKRRIAEALMPNKGHITRGLMDKIAVWFLKQAGNDVTAEGYMKMQDMVITQDQTIRRQSEVIDNVLAIRTQGQELSDKMDLIAAASSPKAMYDEAMEHLKHLQLLFADGQTMEGLQEQIRLLSEENDKLKLAEEELQNRVVSLQYELENVQTDPQTASNSSGYARPQQSGYTQPQNPHAKNAMPSSDDALKIADLQNRLSLQEQENDKLRQSAISTQFNNLLSPEDMKLVQTLIAVSPMLENAVQTLEDVKTSAVSQYQPAPAPKKQSFFGRQWSKFTAMFTSPKKRAQREAEEDRKRLGTSVGAIDGTTERARDAVNLMVKLVKAFNEVADKKKQEMITDINAHQKKTQTQTQEFFQQTFDKYKNDLAAARSETEKHYAWLEDQHRQNLQRIAEEEAEKARPKDNPAPGI